MTYDSETQEKKSSTTAKTALGLAIGGLSLAAINGSQNGGCGILGNLFGGKCEYEMRKADQGQAALTELNMLEKWIMPIMGQVCDLKTQAAVNDERDAKNQAITALLFDFTGQKVNDKFELTNALTDAKIERATCNTIKGRPYISPTQMADPYHAANNYLVTRNGAPVVAAQEYGCDNFCW